MIINRVSNENNDNDYDDEEKQQQQQQKIQVVKAVNLLNIGFFKSIFTSIFNNEKKMKMTLKMSMWACM